MSFEPISDNERQILETRPPRPIFRGAAFGASLLTLLSGFWAYLEYAGERREPIFALALAGVFFSLGFSILLAFRASFTFRTERGRRERPPLAPAEPTLADRLALGDDGIRRRFLLILGTALTGLLGIFLLPLRSLGSRPSDTLRKTGWQKGIRLATVDGRPLRAADLPVGTSVPFIRDGARDEANAYGLLVRLRTSQGDGDPLAGLRAFSSICTHAGCAVSIFLDESSVLVCPCHWSTFHADDGSIVSGPASAPLPSLPIRVDAEGYLVADGDFTRPIGPRLGCSGCKHASPGSCRERATARLSSSTDREEPGHAPRSLG